MSRFLKELFSTNQYKSSQGRIARRLTFIGLSLVFLLGAYCLFAASTFGKAASPYAAAILAIFGVWFSYRTINYPTFADFLVSVEAEMNKVSWPTKRELFSNTKVVLVFMLLFTALIFVYDIIFSAVFNVVNMIFG